MKTFVIFMDKYIYPKYHAVGRIKTKRLEVDAIDITSAIEKAHQIHPNHTLSMIWPKV